jgi:hypothetical protein
MRAAGSAVRDVVVLGLRRRSIQLAVFFQAPLLAVGFLAIEAGRGRLMEDFAWLRAGAQAVVHGHSPYTPPDPGLLAQNDKFVYPALDAYLFAPFAVLPRGLAAVLFLLLSCAAVGVGLRLLGVQDWRCFGVTLISPPTFFALGFGALGPLLFLGAAAAWRYRSRSGPLAMIIGLTFVAKLLLWPLLIWLVATRRWAAAAGAVATALVATVVGWAGIGFDGFREYPTTLRVLNDVQEWKSYSLSGLALALHLPSGVGAAALATVAAGGSLLMFRLARQPDGDRRSFVVASLTALLATPLLWNHYLVLLLVPLALARPRLSWAWALPMLLWLTPHPEAAGVAGRCVLLLGVTAAVAVVALEPSPAAVLLPWRQGRASLRSDP